MMADLSDTTPQAWRKQFEMMRRVPASKRLALALELTEVGRKLILADLCQKFPQAGDEEIRRRFIARLIQRDDVIRAYGFDWSLTTCESGPISLR